MFRVCLGFAVLWHLVLRLSELQTFYGDRGVLSRKLFLEQPVLTVSWQAFLATGSTWGLALLFLSGLVAALALIVGYQARLAGFFCWVFTVSMQLRNPLVLDGGDELLRLLLFWTPFLPLSTRWSVDAHARPEWKSLPESYRSVATVALYLQYSLFYFFAALLKRGPDWLETYEALYYTLSIDQFATRLGKFLTGFPELLKVGTVAGLACEYLLALLLLVPLAVPLGRLLFFTLLLFFHLSLAAMLNLGIFEFITILGATAFIPGTWFKGTVDRTPVEPPVPIERYPDGYRLTRLEQAFAWFIVVYIVVVNIQSVANVEKLNRWTYAVAVVTYEHQHWHLFAPAPFREDGWFIFEVVDSDGRIWHEWGRKGTSEKPELVSAQFPSQRWRRWLQNLVQSNFSGIQELRDSTADYLLKDWARRHPERRAERCRLLFYEEPSVPPGETSEIHLRVLSERAGE